MKNTDRTALTRGELIEAPRAQFAQQRYAATSTGQILAQAGVKRGALHHHFRDKAELFEAACIQVSEEAHPIVERSADQGADTLQALIGHAHDQRRAERHRAAGRRARHRHPDRRLAGSRAGAVRSLGGPTDHRRAPAA